LAVRPEQVTDDAFAKARLLHVDNVDEDAAIAAATRARAAGMIVTTDIDQIGPNTPALIAAATFPILAERIPQALTGEADPERALRIMRSQHRGMLCVTMGAKGSMLLVDDMLYHAPGFQVEAIDTTGAGDVFRGALICSLLRGDAPEAMLRFANAAAAVSCTREGAIAGVPTLEEINRLLGPH
jgi:sulfofructose kinase